MFVNLSRAVENNWKGKSIENLEKDFWGQPPKDSTPLVNNIHRLRAIQIEKLEVRDVRLLIGQKVGLKFLIPVAIQILHNDLFVNAESYEGDLLQIVMRVHKDFWDNNVGLKGHLDNLLKPYSEEDKQKFRNGKFDDWT